MEASAPVPIWLDCDPGHDDAIAILLACHSPSVRLIGISTLHGNQTVDKTTHNALRMLSVAGCRSVPVVAGQAKPLMRPLKSCPEIHGQSGLDCGGEGFPPVETDPPVAENAILFMYRSIMACDQPVSLVAIGGLTVGSD
jgi:inosine-uridine nucleoside N-ribohydrolase